MGSTHTSSTSGSSSRRTTARIRSSLPGAPGVLHSSVRSSRFMPGTYTVTGDQPTRTPTVIATAAPALATARTWFQRVQSRT